MSMYFIVKICRYTCVTSMLLLCILLLSWLPSAQAHHFKGLPHFNYFDNYPQVPLDEFLGQKGEYELSLVVYDFQGIKRTDAMQPNDVRLYLVIYNLRENRTYKGAATLEVFCDDVLVHSERFENSHEESLYATQEVLQGTRDFTLHVTLHDANNIKAVVPFVLSSQKIHWGKWVALMLVGLVMVLAIGSRRARVLKDRRELRGCR